MESIAWDGFWAEDIVASAKSAIASPDTLSVLMTGRSQAKFSDLIVKILNAKGLHFDLTVLKPEVTPTAQIVVDTAMFKCEFFREVMSTYSDARHLIIFEDRAKQAKKFQNFLENWTDSLRSQQDTSRPPFDFQIDLVDPCSIALDPVDESRIISAMMSSSNATAALGSKPSTYGHTVEQIRKYTGYLISPSDATKLKQLLVPPPHLEPEDIRPLADSIMLSFDTPRPDILARAGGMDAQQSWTTVSLGSRNDSIWAVRVQPVEPDRPHPTDRNPIVILGHLPKTKTSEARGIDNWTPIPEEKRVRFGTTVRDRYVCRIVSNSALSRAAPRGPRGGAGYATLAHRKGEDSDSASGPGEYARRGRRGGYANGRPREGHGPYPGRGRGGRGRGGGGGGYRGGGRGRGGGGGGGQYRSLDDTRGGGGYSDTDRMQY